MLHYTVTIDILRRMDNIDNSRKRRIIFLIFFLIYFFTILWFAVLKRSIEYRIARLELFWSYREWFAGNVKLGNEIIANIALFIPFGFLLSLVLPVAKSGKRAILSITIAVLLSLLIETLQLFLMRGLFEWDDIISNTIGSLIGVFLNAFFKNLLNDKHFTIIIISIGTIISVICVACIIIRSHGGIIDIGTDMTSRAYCFQIEDVMVKNGELNISGFAFQYEHPDKKPSLSLQSEKNEVKLITDYGDSRPDVNDYFLCDIDYTNSGFTSVGTVGNDIEYEIMIRWPWSPKISTGVFIHSETIHYASDAIFVPPDVKNAPELMEIVKNGILRIYRPDFHCWVYQLDGDLYWITEPGFAFEDDGTTYIQYQIWTTQLEKLPSKRVAHGNSWDNISGYFEDYELKGNFGPYRIMKRQIPTDYSITSILTGYYVKGNWIWKNYFRPIYKFH